MATQNNEPEIDNRRIHPTHSTTSTSSVKERWMKKVVIRNRGFLAQPINEVGNEVARINHMFPPGKYPLEVTKTLFPRSVIYEIPYKKKQAEIKIQEALRREREALAERVKMKMAGNLDQNKDGQIKIKDEQDEEMQKMREEMKPFWYEEGNETPLPSRRVAEYDVDTGMRVDRPYDENVKQRMGLDDSRNYIPGQISGKVSSGSQGRTGLERAVEDEGVQLMPHPPVPYNKTIIDYPDEITETEKQMNKFDSECHPKKQMKSEAETYPISCILKKGGIERPDVVAGFEFGKTDFKGSACKAFPGRKAKLTSPWDDLRSEEFMKVGRPFKTLAARWTECTMPPFKPDEEIKAVRERLAIKYKDRIPNLKI